MNIMEEIFDIRSCIEILANDIKIYTNWSSICALTTLRNCHKTKQRGNFQYKLHSRKIYDEILPEKLQGWGS